MQVRLERHHHQVRRPVDGAQLIVPGDPADPHVGESGRPLGPQGRRDDAQVAGLAAAKSLKQRVPVPVLVVTDRHDLEALRPRRRPRGDPLVGGNAEQHEIAARRREEGAGALEIEGREDREHVDMAQEDAEEGPADGPVTIPAVDHPDGLAEELRSPHFPG
nr:hypothetical protein [Methylobacterium durans]